MRKMTENASRARNLLLSLACATFAGLLVSFAIVRTFRSAFGHDQAWGVYMAQQWLNGVTIDGPELFEVNPPFLVWFMSLPVLLGKVLHLTPAHGSMLFFVLLFLGILAWSVSLVRRYFPEDGLMPWLFASGLSFGAMGWMPRADIGERDQFAATLLVPYLLYALFRLKGLKLSSLEQILLGITAAVGACLKPQYLLLPVLVEVGLLLLKRKKAICVANLALGAGLLLYAATTVLFGTLYFQNLVPLIRASYYGDALRFHWLRVRGGAPLKLTLVLLVIGVPLAWFNRYRRITALFLFSSMVGLGLYFYQRKGFGYHREPMLEYAMIASAVLVAGMLPRTWSQSKDSFRTACIVALCSVLVGIGIWPHLMSSGVGMEEAAMQKKVAGELFSEYPAGTPVSMLSLGPWEFPAIVDQNKVLGSRFMHLWWMASMFGAEGEIKGRPELRYPEGSAERADALKVRLYIAQDLAHWKPVMVLIEDLPFATTSDLGTGKAESLVLWLQRDAMFREEWQHYTLREVRGTYHVYIRTQP
jgi:hypothetical protein